MLIGVLKEDIEFDYRPDEPYAGMVFATVRKGEWLNLSNPRIAYFDTTFYDGEIPDGNHRNVVLSISEEDVEIINTEWKKIK